jgi:hypothetical protein
MAFLVEDGTGRGYKAAVTDENQLATVAEIHELQHHISRTQGEVYQIIGLETAITASTQTVLHIKNTSSTLKMVVSYIRMQIAGESGGTALTDAATYFQMGFGRTYVSGGALVTPVNMNVTSANSAPCTAYNDSPVMAGTFTEIDRWYPNGDAMQVFNKHGSLILGLNDTMEIRLVTDHTAGHAYARVTAMFIDLAKL